MANLWNRGGLYFLIALFLLFVRHQPPTSVQAARPASINAPVPEIVYGQPASNTPLQHQSSQVGYDVYASDYDQYVWDSFTLNSTRAISEITWRGFYKTGGYWGGGVVDFTVAIYPSAAANTEPDHLNLPLVKYTIGGNAGETPVWTAGAPILSLHDYRFALPTPFTATAGIKYWMQIEGIQNGPADWGVVQGTGGDGAHFYAVPGPGDFRFNTAPNDAAFTLFGPPGVGNETPLAGVTITGPTVGAIGLSYTFTATVSPITATIPITYTWSPTPQSGQGTTVATYTWPTAGTQAITVTAKNTASMVSNTHVVLIYSPLTEVIISGPSAGVVNTTYAFTATVSPPTATLPITYTWSLPHSGQGARVVRYAWSLAGKQTITVTVENLGGKASNTHTIALGDKHHICLPLILTR